MTQQDRPAFLLLFGGFVFTLGCLAAVPGDLGGCGQTAVDLDAATFFQQKAEVDCQRCVACALVSEQCRSACSGTPLSPSAFPVGCFPLVHDGEVCLRALQAASCDAYEEFVRDGGASIPSECNFCPTRDGG